MRKVMFFASTYLLYFAIGFVTLRFVYMWLMDESRLMEETVGKTAVLEKVAFFAPMIIMIVVEIAAFIIGKKLFGSWTWKDKILLPVCSVLGLVSSVILIGLLDP